METKANYVLIGFSRWACWPRPVVRALVPQHRQINSQRELLSSCSGAGRWAAHRRCSAVQRHACRRSFSTFSSIATIPSR